MTESEQRAIFSENIKRLMKERGLTQIDLADHFKMSRSTASSWCTGAKLPRMWKIDELASWLGVPRSQLLENQKPKLQAQSSLMQPTVHKGVRIPVLGSVPAGIPIEAIEDVIDWEELPYEMTKTGSEYFALKVDGLSMYPVILDEDVVIIKKSETCTSGQICLVYVNGTDATLKRVILNDKKRTLTLKPENTNFAPRTFTAQEIEELPVSIGGYVVEIRRKIT